MPNVIKSMLIKSIICEEGRVTNVVLYHARFMSDDALDAPGAFKRHLAAAFKAWASSGPWASEFVKRNGTNWGDALSVEQSFLIEHKIMSYRSAVTEGPLTNIIGINYECEILVDHDESLFDVRELNHGNSNPATEGTGEAAG